MLNTPKAPTDVRIFDEQSEVGLLNQGYNGKSAQVHGVSVVIKIRLTGHPGPLPTMVASVQLCASGAKSRGEVPEKVVKLLEANFTRSEVKHLE
jgi:hypothetical protein